MFIVLHYDTFHTCEATTAATHYWNPVGFLKNYLELTSGSLNIARIFFFNELYWFFFSLLISDANRMEELCTHCCFISDDGEGDIPCLFYYIWLLIWGEIDISFFFFLWRLKYSCQDFGWISGIMQYNG